MFKFNFNTEDDNSSQPETDEERNDGWYESKKLEIPSNITDVVKEIPESQVVKIDYDCGLTFCCLSAEEIMKKLKGISGNEKFTDLLEADKAHSDLLPGRYEGGLKTWECTKDLVIYFLKHVVKDSPNKLRNKCVLDLGCGSGILGIMCLLLEASVTFQDYNEEVLEAMTIFNVFLNCDESYKNKMNFFSGDWSSFLDLTLQTKGESCSQVYDYILTSETIYNPKNYKKIITIFKKLLKHNGSAFVAAKYHYFGVGGNLNEFETLLRQEGFKVEMCWSIEEGVSRGILEVRWSGVDEK